MTRDEIFTGISTVVKDVFADDSLSITEATVAKDVEYWDSLNNIRIIVAVEKLFKVRFSPLDVENLENVGAIVSLVQSKL